MKRIILFFLIIISGNLTAQHELYFIAGTPLHDTGYPHYLAGIFEFKKDSIIELYKLNDKKNELYCIRYYKNNNLVFIRLNNIRFKGDSYILINTKNVLDTIISKIPVFTDYRTTGTFDHMVAQNSTLTHVFNYYNRNAKAKYKSKYIGINTANNEIVQITEKDYINMELVGCTGGTVDNWDAFAVYTNEKNGKISIPVTTKISKRPVFSFTIPKELQLNQKKLVSAYINNKSLFAMVTNRADTSIVLILNKSNSEWNKLLLKGSNPVFRSFNNWICGEVQYKQDKNFKEIPGKKYRNQKDTDYGNSADWRFKWQKIFCPGILYLYNINTKNYIEWNALENNENQGDSEILLVENNMVYYRVNEKIYKRKIIEDKELGERELILEDMRVRDIHWAFISK